MLERVAVIGAGLAGCEAAWQLARRGIPVDLYEMRPHKMPPAHHSAGFAELVCSNSLRADRLENGVGLLKEEMRRLHSVIMQAADAHRVPAGGALAVNRDGFSQAVTSAVCSHPLITFHNEECTTLPQGYVIVATGPLTECAMAEAVAHYTGTLHFFDAAAPIITAESLNMNRVFSASRYGRGEDEAGDYLNCPMNKDEYEAFWQALVEAERAPLQDFENKRVFEGCMPVEVLAARGIKALCFGPMKPVGLTDPHTDRRPYAVLQLRKENREGTLYNMVGCQTNLRQGEQRRVFGMIPGLENAAFARYGVMHRNTYMRAGTLRADFRLIKESRIAFAGQITGVEGYVESAGSGLVAGVSMALELLGKVMPDLTPYTALGALGNYVAHGSLTAFQPSNIHFGLMPPLAEKVKDKAERNRRISQRALEMLAQMTAALEGNT